MLEPRPEIRIATRLRSGIMARGPILWRVPGAGSSADRAAALASFDPADLEDRLAGGFQSSENSVDFLRRGNHGHPNSAVECTGHLQRRDPATLLKRFEDWRQVPTPSVDHRLAI